MGLSLLQIEAIAGRQGFGGNPSSRAMFAAFKALLFAQSNRDSLIKITCSNPQEAASACEFLSHKAVGNNWHRKKDPVTHTEEGWPVLELRNGSGVVIALEEKEEKPHG
jgi:hypothetical protein